MCMRLLYKCVCVCVCVCVCKLCIYVSLYICVYVSVFMCVCVYMCVCVSAQGGVRWGVDLRIVCACERVGWYRNDDLASGALRCAV